MKDKEKQIEEIAKVLNECCNFYDENGAHSGNKCNSHDCEYWCDTNNLCCSYNKKEATALYDAGYRKIDKDSVVLSREEYEKLKNGVHTTNYTAMFDTVRENRIQELENRLIYATQQASKETAEKYHNEIELLIKTCICMHYISLEDGLALLNDNNEIAKQFSVEIKE